MPGALRTMVDGLLASERSLEATLAAARRGRTFSPTQLLELQARVFHHAQVVEVLSRAADRVVGSVKQALNTQV